ncbi:MAG: hydantoinase B/oxoprolinase family protein [Desulfovibrionaceae bacterium]|nr:hydantoinase B/oxoprolinase family protein [Desulfovibrionaceae bacterium]
MPADPILLEVFKNRFASIAEEMGVTLTRTAFSPNIKERRDLSCALFDGRGRMIAQAAHIPVHLGSMPMSVRAAMDGVDMEDGDMVMLNDPFRGGSHLPDITMVAPVFCPGVQGPAFYAANRAHHADVGGMASGSMPLSWSLFQEGLIIPPVKIVRKGRINRELMRLVLANVRTPLEREGDFAAQIMANTTGARRLRELSEKYGPNQTALYSQRLMDYSEALMRRAIQDMPDGTWRFEDLLDDDGLGTEDIRIALDLGIRGDTARLDFSRSADQVPGSVNAVRSIAVSAALYVFLALAGGEVPANHGCLRPIEVVTRPGSVVDARFPAAVAGGNVETSQRLVDVILGALSQAAAERVPAASQGTMNNIAMGGTDLETGAAFAYYETLAGGMGAGPNGPGESAVHSHMTNTLNTPVEALEYAYPLMVLGYGLNRGSGGRGRHRGGDGLFRELAILSECEVTVLSERRRNAPYGLLGGRPGRPGRNIVSGPGGARVMPGKFQARLRPGETLRIETPGGGGYGPEVGDRQGDG